MRGSFAGGVEEAAAVTPLDESEAERAEERTPCIIEERTLGFMAGLEGAFNAVTEKKATSTKASQKQA